MFCFKRDECLVPRSWSVNSRRWTSHTVYFRESLRIIQCYVVPSADCRCRACSRFVLFKRHYEKYLDISQKYEEARNIAYYLEEKYHEIKVSPALSLNQLTVDLVTTYIIIYTSPAGQCLQINGTVYIT